SACSALVCGVRLALHHFSFLASCILIGPPQRSPLFPYTTLFRSSLPEEAAVLSPRGCPGPDPETLPDPRSAPTSRALPRCVRRGRARGGRWQPIRRR